MQPELHNVHQEPLLKCCLSVLVVGNEKDVLHFQTAASAISVKAVELETCKWFRPISCNKWICNCIYHKCARGCFPSEFKQCETLNGAHKNTPKGLYWTKPARHTLYRCDMEYTWCTLPAVPAQAWYWESRTGGGMRDKLTQLAARSRRKCWYKCLFDYEGIVRVRCCWLSGRMCGVIALPDPGVKPG